MHQDLNGDQADRVLQAQREHDAGNAEGLQLIPPNIEPPTQPAQNRALWQIPNQRQLDPEEIYRRPGSFWDFIDLDVMKQVMKPSKPFKKTTLHFAATQAIAINEAGNLAGPSRRQVVDKVNLPVRRSSPAEYHIVELRRFLDLEAHAEDWKLVEVFPNIALIFLSISEHFFKGVARMKFCTIAWHEMPDQTCFLINHNRDARRSEVRLNPMLKSCSRLRLISTLFHICMHIALFATSAAAGRNFTDHDINFRRIMEGSNQNLGLQIGTAHQTFAVREEEKEMFRCENCSHRYFKGIISAENIELVKQVHRQNCTKNFHKVFKANRNFNNNEEMCYIVHNRIAIPQVEGSNAPQTGLQPRELIDLAGDDGEARVVDLVPQVDLVDEEVNVNHRKPRSIVQQLLAQQVNVNQCCFCAHEIPAGTTFGQHIDICMG